MLRYRRGSCDWRQDVATIAIKSAIKAGRNKEFHPHESENSEYDDGTNNQFNGVNSMSKIVFRLFFLGVSTLVVARSSNADSADYMNGQLGPKTDVSSKSGIESLLDKSNDSVSLASCCESAPNCDNRCQPARNRRGNGTGNGCCNGVGNWLDNTQLFFGADAYKSLGDSGLSGFNPSPFALGNSFGGVSGFNTGIRLGESRVRGQVGASYGAYDIKGRTTTAPIKDNNFEQQTFVTVGLNKRSDVCCGDRISWGTVYDQLVDHQWGWAGNDVYLSQIRGIMGYALNETNEVGVWGTFHLNNDLAGLGFPPNAVVTTIRAMNQTNLYLRHNWAFGGNSMMYAGTVDSADIASWQLGMINLVPVSSYSSMFGNFTYVAPGSATGLVGASEEQWNVSVGMVFYLGKKAVSRTVSGVQGTPLLPVANNGSFLITN